MHVLSRPLTRFSRPGFLGLLLILFTFCVGAAHSSPFAICPENALESNTYALCASAQCWTLDGVAYCKCALETGRSISNPYSYRSENGTKKNVCNLLTEGPPNGFTVSTYSTPRQIRKDYDESLERGGPPLALYTCDQRTNQNAVGAYSAQCDGGLCFSGTQGRDFPGLGRLKSDQLICSCPPKANQSPFQIIGPWSCQPGESNIKGRCCDRSFFKRYCGIHSIKKTGTLIPVGAPAGVGRRLSNALDLKRVEINECFNP